MKPIHNTLKFPYHNGDILHYIGDDECYDIIIFSVNPCRNPCHKMRIGQSSCRGYMIEDTDHLQWCVIPEDFAEAL